MSQINLDTSPYFDDFDADKDYYKVLFKPGFPVQARELTVLQSILQNQISSFGEHFFKEGSMVIPGSITYNPNYYAVLLNVQQGGVDVSLYLEELIGTTIRGETSGVKGKVVNYILPPDNGVTDPTIFVSYSDSGTDEETSTFLDNEALINEDPVVYGNTTITSGSIFATTISTNATTVGSAAKIGEGVYFLRGTFVKVAESTVILEPYVNTSTFRVGLQITERVITAGQDDSLYDNAKGFNNFSAPGADRLQITATLTKKPINDFNDTNFVELLRVNSGEVKKLEDNSDYNIIKDYIAQRTYDESGDYVVKGMNVDVDNCLNDGVGNSGVYLPTQLTEEGNTPSDDLAVVKVSSGTAYVRGYDINKPGTTNIDVPKPRTTETVESTNIPFEMGSRYIVNNVIGTPVFGLDLDDNIVELYDGRSSSGSPTGNKIGEARVYTFGLEDAPYTSNLSPWSLYLYDLQIYNKVTLNVSAASITAGYRVTGRSSNASAYVRSVSGRDLILTQVSGEFQRGESLAVSGNSGETFTITQLTRYSSGGVKSVFQNSASLDPSVTTSFCADTRQYNLILQNFTSSDIFTITSGGSVTCPGRFFNDLKIGDLIAYQKPGETLVTYNSVTAISADEKTATVAAVPNVANVCSGTLPSSNVEAPVRITQARVLNQENAFLYANMEKKNVASVDLGSSALIFSGQVTDQSTDAEGTLVVGSSDLNVSGGQFYAFDQERYSIHYADGTIQSINADEVNVQANAVTFYNCKPSQTTNVTVNVTAVKPSIRSKTKIIIGCEEFIVDKISSGVGTAEFGLSKNAYYGLRVDDEEVSLNVADVKEVIAVYESLDSADPALDVLGFVNGLELEANLVVGESLVGAASGAVARVVSIPSPSTVRIVYLSQDKFEIGELITFNESSVSSNLQQITEGNYIDLTSSFTLDAGQREQFYDFSRIVRARGAKAPNKKLLVIYDRFDVPANDKGDFYTANSYDDETFAKGMPLLKNGTVRASDTLDFRPRVSKFTSTTASPFDYLSRDFGAVGSTPTLVTAPNEGMRLGYDFYLGRTDRVILDSTGQLKISQGAPAESPALPTANGSSLELARIEFPPYVYDIDDIKIITVDNKRYTMKDIGKLEDRIENLEEITSLSLLERETESLQVLDADGNSRFKTGFFADDFTSSSFVDFENPDTNIDIVPEAGVLVAFTEFATLPLTLQLQNGIDDSQLDLSVDLPLLDENTTKTGDLVTLDYVETEWIKQPLASRVENVNPFNVVLYNGNVRLSPRNDDFVETRNIGNRRIDVYGESTGSFNRTFVEGIEVAQYMRERNISFQANGLRPHTRFYPFFEGASGIDIIPKLLEITMRSGAFLSGETIDGFNGNTRIFRARLAAPNHKAGNFAAPTRVYTRNPYNREVTIATSYSASSIILNIDTESLANIADERFFGLLSIGARLVGSSSGAVADVADLRLVSDTFGELGGAFFFRDPYNAPAPAFRLRTGIRTFRLTSSAINATAILGSSTVSFAEAVFESGGTVQNRRSETVSIRDLPPPPPPVIIDRTVTNNFTEVIDRTKTINNVIDRTVTVKKVIDKTKTNNIIDRRFIDRTKTVTIDNTVTNNITRVEKQIVRQFIDRTKTIEIRYDDPLSQTFRVDETGAFLTSVNIFMASKSETDNLIVQLRPTELATPTNFLIQDYAEVVLSPDQVVISSDASLPTNVTFPSPIYLEPDITYALVVLAPTTNDYTAWIARMGETNIDGASEETGGDVIISQQYLNGSLFKSQNGSIWTPSQFEDLKFTLFKAAFVTDTPSTVYLSNPDIGNQTQLINNPIKTLPRKIQVPVSTGGYVFKAGDEISSVIASQPDTINVRGSVEAVGGPTQALSVDDAGIGFVDGSYTDVELYPLDTFGEGATANVTISSGSITSISLNQAGTGYRVGDTVGLVTADAGESGGDSLITIDTIGQTDTLFLTNTLGQSILAPDAIKLYDASTNTLTDVGASASGASAVLDPMYSGNVMEVELASHSMHSDQNYITLANVLPDTKGVAISQEINLTSNNIVVVDNGEFTSYEGISTAVGYALIGGEIIEYTNNNDGTLGITSRGVDNTAVSIHDQGDRIFKYEISGVSLRKINTVHKLPINSTLGFTRDLNTLPIEFDRIGRGTDGSPGIPQLNFNQEQQAGGNNAFSSQNIQYSRLYPSMGILTPGSTTSANATVRTVTGTSAGGNEESFVDQGYIPVTLNDFNRFETTRLVCSKINETENLDGIPRNKSFTLALQFNTSDPNLSPVIDMNQMGMVLTRNAINKPITNFADDPRVNLTVGDPHSSIYISTRIDLKNVSTSLKVLLSAYRDETADMRVLYRLFTTNSEGSTEPTWELFPGFSNLVDTDGDGFGDRIVDPSKNNGTPNKKVRASAFNEVLEYEYSVNTLPEFSGYQIKVVFSGTNEARAPFLKDIRSIALA